LPAPTVTVVIPAFNAADTIGRALASLRAQTYPHLEIIVVDDGSADDTAQRARRERAAVRCIRQDNAGPSAARNRGVQEASGELVAFLDADDEFAPEKVARQVEVLTGGDDVQVCGTNGLVVEGRRSYPFNATTGPALIRRSFHDIVRDCHPVMASLMLPRALFLDAGGYDPSMRVGEDKDLLLRLAGSGCGVVEINQPLYIMHRRPGTLSTARAEDRASRVAAIARWDPERNSDRTLHRLSRLSYPAFRVMGNAYQNWHALVGASRRWGGFPGLARQGWRRYIGSRVAGQTGIAGELSIR